MGGHGLYSTVSDYMRFIRMWLNDGNGEHGCVLKSDTAVMAEKNHLGAFRMAAVGRCAGREGGNLRHCALQGAAEPCGSQDRPARTFSYSRASVPARERGIPRMRSAKAILIAVSEASYPGFGDVAYGTLKTRGP